MSEKIRIYVVAHKKFEMPTKNALYQPIYVGNIQKDMSDEVCKDSTGINISDKNPWYNELTAIYWIWKNSAEDIVGICHYRRFFTTFNGKLKNLLFKKADKFIDEGFISKALKNHDIIVHNKTFFKQGNANQLTKKDNLSDEENKNKVDKKIVELSREIFKKVHPEDIDMYDKVMVGSCAHLLNIIIARKSDFDAYCEWLFPFLFDLEDAIKMKYPDEEFPRVIGLVAERIMDVWIAKSGIRVKECFTLNTERIDWKMW